MCDAVEITDACEGNRGSDFLLATRAEAERLTARGLIRRCDLCGGYHYHPPPEPPRRGLLRRSQRRGPDRP